MKWTDGNETSSVLQKELQLEKKKLDVVGILLVILQVGDEAMFEAADKQLWPKDFFHALVKSDWRQWVAAVKKEISGWDDNETYDLIEIAEKTQGSSIVPLGELYTRKKDLSYKFRQYMMGQLLKKGKDFRDTFSTTVSWDGVRWFASLACACSKRIYGHDAITGYLQAPEMFDIYAFCPSHEEYSRLPYEELAVLRKELLGLLEREGPQGLQKFANAHKRDSRVNPKKCLRINRSVYGNPGAGHAFEMLMQGAHIQTCGMTQTEVEPSIYVKFQVDENDKVVEYLIATGWTDDFRHFGTDLMREQYCKDLSTRVKVTNLGECNEFVGVEFLHDLDRQRNIGIDISEILA